MFFQISHNTVHLTAIIFRLFPGHAVIHEVGDVFLDFQICLLVVPVVCVDDAFHQLSVVRLIRFQESDPVVHPAGHVLQSGGFHVMGDLHGDGIVTVLLFQFRLPQFFQSLMPAQPHIIHAVYIQSVRFELPVAFQTHQNTAWFHETCHFSKKGFSVIYMPKKGLTDDQGIFVPGFELQNIREDEPGLNA